MANDGVLPGPDFGPARLNKDNSADNPASEQGVKHSAILPDAGGEGSGCAHHQKGRPGEVDTRECPKPPNELKGEGKITG